MSTMRNTGIPDKRVFRYICHVFTATEYDILWTYYGATIENDCFRPDCVALTQKPVASHFFRK